MRISKWGNSLAIRIPADVARMLGLKEGGEVELVPIEGHYLGIGRTLTREEAIHNLRRFRGLLPADFKFDRDEANAR